MATIREVAAIAGVSRSTVSLVLNDSPLVKAETREKVLEVIRELNYVPNNSARSLSSKVTKALGIVVLSEHAAPDCYDMKYETGLYSRDIQTGISSRLANTDYSLIVEHYDTSQPDYPLPKVMQGNKVDGVFMVGGFYSRELHRKMKQSGIPFVIIGGQEEDNDCVWADSGEGAYLGFKYLTENGYKNICYLNCPANFASNRTRLRGIERFVRESGFDFNWDWLIDCEKNNGEGGYLAMKALWEKGVRPDGMLSANSPIAMGAVKFLYEQGVAIPRDTAVVAYEDNILCAYTVPALTSINIRKEYMGKKAADLLLERLVVPEKAYEAVRVEPYLV